jgi:hypothetical protein
VCVCVCFVLFCFGQVSGETSHRRYTALTIVCPQAFPNIASGSNSLALHTTSACDAQLEQYRTALLSHHK